MRRYQVLGLIGMVCAASMGCGLSMPRWRTPGYLYQQQLRATFHDPYGAREVAPEIVGGRPRMYATPRSQESQAQWELDQRL